MIHHCVSLALNSLSICPCIVAWHVSSPCFLVTSECFVSELLSRCSIDQTYSFYRTLEILGHYHEIILDNQHHPLVELDCMLLCLVGIHFVDMDLGWNYFFGLIFGFDHENRCRSRDHLEKMSFGQNIVSMLDWRGLGCVVPVGVEENTCCHLHMVVIILAFMDFMD